MRVYTIVSATLLLLIGAIGLAFKDQFNVPLHILVVDLILGLWGLFVIFSSKK